MRKPRPLPALTTQHSALPCRVDLLAGLNEAQRQAVEHDSGPLVVLAGPGTGKTRLIVHRVAHLILERGVKPEQIVALTFTVKACEQMRQKLTELMSAGSAADVAKGNLVNIHTYHGFGHRLVRRFADRLGLPSRVELIDSAQRKRLLRELIQRDRHMVAMLGEGVDAAAQHAGAVIDALRDYAVDGAGAVAFAQEWGARIDRNDEKLDAPALAGARAERAIFEQTARLMCAVEAEQRRRGWLSMSEMITEPIRLLRTDQLARDLIRAELRHAVVDEFQDVNEATIVLLEHVFPPASSPDLCVVGDDDQAIYGFRGADDRAFQKFTDRWRGAEQIKLEENYRSQPSIIAVANATIANAGERFDATKTVRRAERFKGEAPPVGGGVVVVENERYGDNGEPIAAMILAERQKNPAVRWSDFAVVARGHGELDKVSLALEAEGIPVVRRRERSALNDQGVKDLMAWCRVLVNPRDIEHARRLLLRPPVAFTGPRVIRLLSGYQGVMSVADVGEGEDPGAFIPWLAAQLPGEPAIQRLASVYAEFREKAAGVPAGQLVYELALRVDAVHGDLLPAVQRAVRLAAVVSFLRFAINRQPRLPEPGDLRAFLEYFDDLSGQEQEGLDDQMRVDGGDSEGEADGDGVRLMTAHGSKGLEFDTVFVPRVNPGNGNYPSTRAPDQKLPGAMLVKHGTSGDARQRQVAEERRLFYVACTRAERRLVILGNIPKSEGESTHLLRELLVAQPALPIERTDAQSVNTAFRSGSAATIVTKLREGIARRDRTRVADELSTRTRIDAAAALDAAAQSASDPSVVEAAGERLAASARRLAMIAHAHATGQPPAWSLTTAEDAAESQAIAEAINAAAPPASADVDGIAFDAPRPPLRLSYSEIDQFNRCPACWYLKYRLRLEKPASAEINVGNVAHEALCDFYLEWSNADAESRPRPATARLLEIGRAKFVQHASSSGAGVDRAELERMLAMLTTAHESLHGHDGHDVHLIEKPELSLTFPYITGGVTHLIKAKIDRLERTSSGGIRIVDYKTGQDWARLIEPKKDDLQMGIYALAIDHHFGGAPGDGTGDQTPGVAEYWLLAKGTVGSIALDKIDRKKIRKTIDGAIAGILSGDYEPDSKCNNGLCALLRPGVVVDP